MGFAAESAYEVGLVDDADGGFHGDVLVQLFDVLRKSLKQPLLARSPIL